MHANSTLTKCTSQMQNPGCALKQSTQTDQHPKKLKQSPIYTLQTDLAKNISKVIDDQDLVIILDKARAKWKSSASKQLSDNCAPYQNYLDILTRAQTKVLAAHHPLRDQLRQWDKDFFLSKNREPYEEDYRKDGNAYKLYKKLTLCKNLLQHWNITLHC